MEEKSNKGVMSCIISFYFVSLHCQLEQRAVLQVVWGIGE